MKSYGLHTTNVFKVIEKQRSPKIKEKIIVLRAFINYVMARWKGDQWG